MVESVACSNEKQYLQSPSERSSSFQFLRAKQDKAKCDCFHFTDGKDEATKQRIKLGGGRVIPFLGVQIAVTGNPSFCICIRLQGKHFCAFYECSAWDHYICNSLCSVSAPIGLNIREVSPQVWMNLWPFAKHAEILLLRIITELTSLQGEEEITGANFFAKP